MSEDVPLRLHVGGESLNSEGEVAVVEEPLCLRETRSIAAIGGEEHFYTHLPVRAEDRPTDLVRPRSS